MADFRSVYFDRARGGKNSTGKWMTITKTGPIVEAKEHANEAMARASIGLQGGSADPYYQPAGGKTGYEQVEL